MPRMVTRRQTLVAAGGVTLGTTLAMMLAACGEAEVAETPAEPAPAATAAPAPAPAPAAETPPQKKAVEIEFVHDHVSGPRGEAMKWGLSNFASRYPNINVRFVSQPSDFVDSFAILQAANSQGEVALLSGHFFMSWAESDAFVQINDALSKNPRYDANATYFAPDAFTINFWNRVPSSHLEPISGPQYGLPYQGNLFGYAYNTTLMADAGVEFPTAGNWGLEGEFRDALRQCTDAEQNTFGCQATAGGWPHNLTIPLAMADRDDLMPMYNSDASRLEVYDDGGDRGLRYLIDLIQKDKVSYTPEHSQQLKGEFQDPFSAGNVMTLYSGGSVQHMVNRIKDRFEWSMGPVPEDSNGTPHPVVFDGQPHHVTSTARRRGTVEESVELINFFVGPEVQTRIAIDRGSFPYNKEALASPEMAAGPPGNHGIWNDYAQRTDHRHLQWAHPHWPEMWGLYRWDKTVTGEESVDEAIARMTSTADTFLERTHDDWASLKRYMEAAS